MGWKIDVLRDSIVCEYAGKRFLLGPDVVGSEGVPATGRLTAVQWTKDGHLVWECVLPGLLIRHCAIPSSGGLLRIESELCNPAGTDLHVGNVDLFGLLEVGDGCGWDRSFVSAQTMLGDEGIIVEDRDLASYGYFGMTTADGRSSAVLGFVDVRESFCLFIPRRTQDGSGYRILARCCLEGIRFSSGRAMILSPLVILADETGMSAQLAAYARLAAGCMGTRIDLNGAVKTGWCSWYTYYGRENEADILRNVRMLAEAGLQEKFKVIQLDDGWNLPSNEHPKVWGDWVPGAKFPRGMRAVVDDIHTAGFEAGLWLAPFTASEDSQLYKTHPDWFVGSTEGSILMLPEYGLDLSRPEVLAYLKETFHRVFQEWAFDYVKLDFLLYGSMEGRRHDDTVTSAQVFRKGLEVIREVAGDRFVLACGAPILQCAGLVDGMRLGADVGARWALPVNVPAWPHGNCAVKPAAVSAFYRDFYNGILWQNDPDCIVVRDCGTADERVMFGHRFIGHDMTEADYGLSQQEAAFWVETLRMTGGMLLLSEVWEALSPEQRQLVLRCCEKPAGHVRMVDWYVDPEVVVLQEEGSDGEIGFFNMKDAETEVRIPLSRFRAGLRQVSEERLAGHAITLMLPARSATIRTSSVLMEAHMPQGAEERR